MTRQADIPQRDSYLTAFSNATDYASAIRAVRWLHSGHHRYVTDPTDEVPLLDWAREYNGYERIAGEAELISRSCSQTRDVSPLSCATPVRST